MKKSKMLQIAAISHRGALATIGVMYGLSVAQVRERIETKRDAHMLQLYSSLARHGVAVAVEMHNSGSIDLS